MKKYQNLQNEFTIPYCWRDIPSGLHYQRTLESHLDCWWPKIFGLGLLKLGYLSMDLSIPICSITHQLSYPLSSNQLKHLHKFKRLQLPFSSNWFDVCLLAHTLSYVANPYELLCETDRVLSEQGWLIISGFNPLSVLSINKWLPKVHYPYGSRLFSHHRVIDWLYLLNYHVLSCSLFQLLPCMDYGVTGKFLDKCFPIFGCQYLIVARKQPIPLQMVRPHAYGHSWCKLIDICRA